MTWSEEMRLDLENLERMPFSGLVVGGLQRREHDPVEQLGRGQGAQGKPVALAGMQPPGLGSCRPREGSGVKVSCVSWT